MAKLAIKSENRKQILLLPPSLDELVPVRSGRFVTNKHTPHQLFAKELPDRLRVFSS